MFYTIEEDQHTQTMQVFLNAMIHSRPDLVRIWIGQRPGNFLFPVLLTTPKINKVYKYTNFSWFGTSAPIETEFKAVVMILPKTVADLQTPCFQQPPISHGQYRWEGFWGCCTPNSIEPIPRLGCSTEVHRTASRVRTNFRTTQTGTFN